MPVKGLAGPRNGLAMDCRSRLKSPGAVALYPDCLSTPRLALLLAVFGLVNAAQDPQFEVAERQIVRLPPAAFPRLPGAVIRELQRRGCTIPQEALSKQPNNVVRGQFARRGQTDWAVLCSVHGASSILVFWSGSSRNPAELAEAEDRNYLQSLGDDKVGFSRGISAARKNFITQHHRAYGGPTLPPIDHQGINDAFLEKASIVHYFFEGKWLQLTGSD